MKRLGLTGWLCVGVIVGALGAIIGFPVSGGIVFSFCVLWLIVHTAGMQAVEEKQDWENDSDA